MSKWIPLIIKPGWKLVDVSADPVSQAEWSAFCKETGRAMIDQPYEWSESAPVVFVSNFDAREYCSHYGFRLPTEPEWRAAVMQSGITDTSVWEWINTATDDRGLQTVLGGSYEENRLYPRSAYIHAQPPHAKYRTIGFRVARDITRVLKGEE